MDAAATEKKNFKTSSNQKFQHFDWQVIDSFRNFETVAKSSNEVKTKRQLN